MLSFITDISPFCIPHSLLSNSASASSELRSLLEKHDQHSFQGICECLFVRREFIPFPFENPTHSKSRFLLSFRQRFPEAWKMFNISPAFLHAWLCLRTRDTKWDSTYFALLRKQWWSQPSHVCCVVHFRRIHRGREVVEFRVETASSPKVSWPKCARCWLQWETWAHNLQEEIVLPTGQRTNLNAEWLWTTHRKV